MLRRCRLSSRPVNAMPCSRATSFMRSMRGRAPADAAPAPRRALPPRTGACGRRASRRCRRRKRRGRRSANASLQVGRDPLRVVADIARPTPARRPRAASSSITLGRCLSARLPGQDLVADDEQADVHAARPRGGSGGKAPRGVAGRRRRRRRRLPRRAAAARKAASGSARTTATKRRTPACTARSRPG